jgi:hypothetical protein
MNVSAMVAWSATPYSVHPRFLSQMHQVYLGNNWHEEIPIQKQEATSMHMKPYQ